MNDRTWRTLAIEWFEIWQKAAMRYFDNPPIVIQAFVADTRKILGSNDRHSLELFRMERATRASREVVPIDTALIAICDLALEDFR